MFKIVKKEDIERLENKKEELERELFDARHELFLARMVINDLAININSGVSKDNMGELLKSQVLYQLMAYNYYDSEVIKRFYNWVLPKEMI